MIYVRGYKNIIVKRIDLPNREYHGDLFTTRHIVIERM